MTVRVRIAPSPTGYLHFGTVRSALYNYLFARKHGGVFVVRIEDTDTARNKKEYDDDIFEQLKWLGLSGDEVYRQSEHYADHKKELERLIAEGKAYRSKEPAKDDQSREVEVIRLKNPGRSITFSDEVRGDITFDTTELGDFVIARAIDDPLFHFAVVVDDQMAKITHVIRGEDHISNTPRQILIQEALGYSRPVYAHLPMLLMPDKTKMSKRKHQTSLRIYREAGYLRDAIINFTIFLGWNPGGEREMFTLEEIIPLFDIARVQTHGAVFNEEKLRWFNREYLKRYSDEQFAEYVTSRLKAALEERGIAWDNARALALIPILRERIDVAADITASVIAGEYDFFFRAPDVDKSRLGYKKQTVSSAIENLTAVRSILESADTEYTPQGLKNALMGYADTHGRGEVLWPLRYALSGLERSPDPFTIASILGREETLTRIDSNLK